MVGRLLMRSLAVAVLCTGILLSPVRADEAPDPAAKQPAPTAEERKAANEKALKLSRKLGPLMQAGKYSEAIPMAREALALVKVAYGADHVEVARAASNLGVMLEMTGAYAEARTLQELALRMARRVHGDDHLQVGMAHGNLGAVLGKLAEYERAVDHLERALAVLQRALGPEHQHVMTTLSNLGLVLGDMGYFVRARAAYERALAIGEKALGREHIHCGSMMQNLAGVLADMGAWDEARALRAQDLKIYQKSLRPDHPWVAVAMLNLALLLLDVGAIDEAAELIEPALPMAKKALGASHPTVSHMLLGLAAVHRARGAWEAARSALARSIAITEDTLGDDHPSLTHGLIELARVLRAQGKSGEGVPLVQRAVRIREERLGRDHPLVADALRIEADLRFDAKDHAAAGALLQRCLALSDHHVRRELVGLSPAQRLSAVRRLRHHLNAWLMVAPHVGRTGYEEVLRFKGLVSRATAAERAVMRASGASVRGRIQALRLVERRVANMAAQVPSAFPRKGAEERRKQWVASYAALVKEREALALGLSRDLGLVRGKRAPEVADLKRIRKRLGPRGALIDIVRLDGEYVAWIVRSRGDVRRVGLGDPASFEAAAHRFASEAADAESKEAHRAAGTSLHALLFGPLAKHLGDDVRRLYVCPDAVLATVPLAALPGKKPGSILAEDYRLVLVTMAQHVVPTRQKQAQGKGALLIGGVDYEQATEKTSGKAPATARGRRSPRGSKFMALDETTVEVEAIRGRLGEGTHVLKAWGATEHEVRSRAAGKRVLHLATHGFVRSDLMRGLSPNSRSGAWHGVQAERNLARGHDPMVLAGLALAGANKRAGGGADDGIFTALEASHLDLRGTELVVLSACETALGRAASGEGVRGLVHGFRMAGAARVVGSQWRVDDDATRALMTRFYKLWTTSSASRADPAEALRQAQLHVRAQAKWRHPY